MSLSQSITALLAEPQRAPKNRAPSRDLLSDESGATMVMGIFMAAMLVGMIYYVWGIGGMVIHRERLQDAVDTAAFGAAVVEARGMNLISLINVIMLALAIIGTALRIAVEIVMWTAIYATADCIAKLSCCWATGCCIEPCIDAADHWMDYDDISDQSDSWNDRIDSAMNIMHGASNGIRRGAPVAAQGLVVAYGMSVYRPTTDFGLADIIPLSTTLPVEDDDTNYACGDGSFYGLTGGPRFIDTPTTFGLAVMAGAALFSALATDVDAHYALGLVTGGALGWYQHGEEYCGDYDSFYRIPEDDWLGEEPFQVRALMHGAPPFTWTEQGVAVANWGRMEGTESILSAIPSEYANSISLAQAEFYWEDEDGDVKQEWMFEPRWRARLRRVSLANVGGPLGGLISAFARVIDPVMIH